MSETVCLIKFKFGRFCNFQLLFRCSQFCLGNFKKFLRIWFFYCLDALTVFRLCCVDLDRCVANALVGLLVNVSAMEQGFLCTIV